MDAKYIRELMQEINEEALNMDGFEKAVMGIVERFGMSPVFYMIGKNAFLF